MTRSLQKPLEKMLAARRCGRPLVLLFDYDGTLTPLVAHHRWAYLSSPTRQLLQGLADRPQVFVGVVSERLLGDLKQLVGIPGLCYGGSSGLELEFWGKPRVHPQSASGHFLVAEAAERLKAVVARHPRAWLEEKSFGLTLHYGEVTGHEVHDLCCETRRTFLADSERWRIFEAPRSLEATLALGPIKASVLQMMLDQAGEGAFPFYAGDASHDREALETAVRLGGTALGIGPRAPAAAEFLLADPSGLGKLLGRLLGFLDLPGFGGKPQTTDVEIVKPAVTLDLLSFDLLPGEQPSSTPIPSSNGRTLPETRSESS